MIEKALVGTENFKNPEQKQRHELQVYVAKRLEEFVHSCTTLTDDDKGTVLAMLRDARRRIGANGSVPLHNAKEFLINKKVISRPGMVLLVIATTRAFRATLRPGDTQQAKSDKGPQGF